jgi:hypothetical protein
MKLINKVYPLEILWATTTNPMLFIDWCILLTHNEDVYLMNANILHHFPRPGFRIYESTNSTKINKAIEEQMD